MIPVSGLREDLEYILDRRGVRAHDNGTIIYDKNKLRIKQDCDDIELYVGGELVRVEPSANSRRPRFLNLGDGDWVNEIRELVKEIGLGART
jgi:hypothetical protein